MSSDLTHIIQQYKADSESVYNTWFVNNEDRLKAFRSIRRGIQQVIDDIKNKKFGNDFKGTSLEFVLNCITEQRQVFEGASTNVNRSTKTLTTTRQSAKHETLPIGIVLL